MITQLYAPIPAACDAEIVIIEGDDIYNMWHLPSNVLADVFLNQQPIWRIERIHKTENNGITTYTRMYPDGNTGFAFVADEYYQYTYTFKK